MDDMEQNKIIVVEITAEAGKRSDTSEGCGGVARSIPLEYHRNSIYLRHSTIPSQYTKV